MLIANTPFQYAHLIKFERPSRPDSSSGQVSTSAERYTYITDASRDVVFDDGSVSNTGTSNGPQTYVANKVLKVSAVAEETEAKASSYALVLDGNGLGAFVSGNSTVTASGQNRTITWTDPNVNLIKLGFREGDKVTVTVSGVSYNLNINKFTAKNVCVTTPVDAVNIPNGTLVRSMSLASDEIISILMDKNSTNYSSFVNREVYIHRAYFQNGQMVGTPFLLFKGIISSVGFDDADSALTVTWNLTSHWGDFSQVKGRISSDDFHRALDQNGVPQPASALKVAYAYDKGFSHAETSINILAQYSVQVEKQDVSVKSGFLGIGSKVKVKKYFVNETRNSELDFQLQAKSIPIIYGVRNTPGIPIFADTLNDSSSTVYVIQALSEGEIGGIYDVYIDGNSLICNDKSDFDARSTQTTDNTVQLICRGRADRGDVLGGTVSTLPIFNDFYDTYYSEPGTPWGFRLPFDYNWMQYYPTYVPPVAAVADNTGAGVVDGQSITLTSPQQITMDVFSGKPGQKAASSLVTIAKANNFKIQNQYWNGIDTADYWGPNHRLLDTAYVVNKFIIEEGETTIPTVEFVVRGKTVDCYNYDKSYSHYNKVSGESATNFNLGDYVSLQKMDGTVLVSSTQIVDKWTFTNTDGTANTRFRFSVDPPLSYVEGVPQVTQFKMVNGASQTWTMITYNFKELEGSRALEWKTQITGVTNVNGYVRFTFSAGVAWGLGGDPSESSGTVSVTDVNGYPISNQFFGNAVLTGIMDSTGITTNYSWDAASVAAQGCVGQYLVRRDGVSLPTGASATDGYYNNYLVTLTRVDPVTGKKTSQTKKIINYVGSTRQLATVDGLWDYGYHQKDTDIVSLTPAYADSRVSINPAMQLMDYVCSPTYGRGLDPIKDLNFQSWLTTARKCDTQSNVTVQKLSSSSAPAGGSVYRYPSTGQILWQGRTVGSDGDFIEFDSVLGKLTNAWNNWKSYKVNELVYADNNVYMVTVAGIKLTKPIHTTGTVDGLAYQSTLFLTKVSGSGSPANIGLNISGNPVRALKDGSIIPGYSLYDCDGVDYWRLIGWDELSQRYVTQHQTNIIIDTSLPLFDNVNSLLEHFGGIMRYSNGQYYLEMEEAESPISNLTTVAHNITADHIIGKIRLTDDGIRSAFNSLTAAYSDPANKFESRNISFFNSNYVKADRGVPKKGTLTVPGITNYYNTRILSDRFLNKSRFGLTISFNMAPRGTILLAGQVVQLQYPRYNWVDKKFRIITLTHQEDATVDIVAEEYDDSFYGLSKISKQAASGLAGNNGSVTTIDPPSELRATNVDNGTESLAGVEVTWVNNPNIISRNVFTELYSSYSSNLYVNITTIAGNVLTTAENPHGLKVGEQITSQSTIAGLQAGKTYFIKSIPSNNQLVLSDTRDGPISGLTDMTNVGAVMQTANLAATIPVPASAYIDVFPDIDNRVTKYYWVRHKVVQQG